MATLLRALSCFGLLLAITASASAIDDETEYGGTPLPVVNENEPVKKQEIDPTPDIDIAELQGALVCQNLWYTLEIVNQCARGKTYYDALKDGDDWRDAISVAQEKLDRWGFPKTIVSNQVVPAAETVQKLTDSEEVTVPANVMYVRFSKSFLETFFCKQFDYQLPVRDTILGATVRGTSRTIARTELTLDESPKQAQAVLLFKGAAAFNTTSYSGPVRIRSRGQTDFTSEKKLWFDGANVHRSAAVTSAETHTKLMGIDTDLPGLRRRVALNVASREEAASHKEAENISSERAKKRVEKAFEETVNERVAAFTEELKTQYAKLPFDGRFAIEEIQCSTTPNMLQIVVIGRGEKEPTFVDPPELLSGDPDITVHIHTSLVQKAILEPELRETLHSAVTAFVDKPLVKVASATRKGRTQEPERKLKIHWFEGNGMEWLSLAWHAKDQEEGAKPRRETKRTDRVTVRVKP